MQNANHQPLHGPIAAANLASENAALKSTVDLYAHKLGALGEERDRLAAENAALKAQMTTDAQQRQVAADRSPMPPWAPIRKTFAEMCERMVDSSRLAGIEVETEDGERYLIGDVNPGGYREHGQAFRRDVVITRARVRVQR